MSSPRYTSPSAVGIAISTIRIAVTIGATRTVGPAREARGITSQVALSVVAGANGCAIGVRCRTIGVAAARVARVAGVWGGVWHCDVDVFVNLQLLVQALLLRVV